MACPLRRSGIGESSIMSRRRQSFLLSLVIAFLVLQSGVVKSASASLAPFYYAGSCPNLESIVRNGVKTAFSTDQRIVASLTRLHFHDCFVNGCDGSILLKDTATFSGEQSAFPNVNSARGFDVIDNIKTAVEAACPKKVSCADILAIAARDSVNLAGGPTWIPLLGRYDSASASQAAANTLIPNPISNLNTLTSMFANVGLSQKDVVVLSGAHTFGKARCVVLTFSGNSRLYNWSINSDFVSGTGKPDPHMDAGFLASLQANCPQSGSNSGGLNDLDVQTDVAFDNNYYKNLVVQKGLLNSDQALAYQSAYTQGLVQTYANSQLLWFFDFAISMIKMGNISPKDASSGQIRLQCGYPNPTS